MDLPSQLVYTSREMSYIHLELQTSLSTRGHGEHTDDDNPSETLSPLRALDPPDGWAQQHRQEESLKPDLDHEQPLIAASEPPRPNLEGDNDSSHE